MLFKAQPYYAVSLSKLVVFNAKGEYTTENEKLIEELKRVPKISVAWQPVKEKAVKVEAKKEEVKEEIVEEKTEEETVDELAKLREEYKEKFGKKAFGGRDIAKLQEKLA